MHYAQVRWDDIAGRKVHHIAHHHLVQGDVGATRSLAQDAAGGLYHLGQRLRRIAAALLLHEAHHPGHQHHHANDSRGGEVAAVGARKNPVGQHGDRRDEHQDVGEGVREGQQEANRPGLAVGMGDDVGSPELARDLDLMRGQPSRMRVELVVHTRHG